MAATNRTNRTRKARTYRLDPSTVQHLLSISSPGLMSEAIARGVERLNARRRHAKGWRLEPTGLRVSKTFWFSDGTVKTISALKRRMGVESLTDVVERAIHTAA